MVNRLLKIFISHNYQYSFQNYLDKEFIYSPGYKQIKVEPRKDKIYLSEKELIDWEEYDAWPKLRNTYNCKIIFEFSDDLILVIPSPILFGPCTDDELILSLAVLDYASPTLNFEYYKVGEKYGSSDSTKVKEEGKLVKTIAIRDNNGNQQSLIDFVVHQIDLRTEVENNEIVKDYLKWIKDIKEEREQQKLDELSINIPQESTESYFDSSYYNDGLDLDQQSPEFWDSL